ncbi:MAG: arylesterase [Rhodospirillales bacterium]|nr:arylesterase [Rhodospirillales bacterium]
MVLCAVVSPARADEVTILALGDSLTAGLGLDQADAFPAQLETALRDAGHTVTVVNAGVSGDTSAGGRSRLEWLLTPEIDAVIVELGANDGLRGLDPGETRANLEWILAALKQRGLPVLLTGMQAPPNLGQDYGREFNALYPDLAQRYGALFDPFYLEGVAADPALNQPDGIHPNAQGVAIIVNRLKLKGIELLVRAKHN